MRSHGEIVSLVLHLMFCVVIMSAIAALDSLGIIDEHYTSISQSLVVNNLSMTADRTGRI